jgi:hypothetical protein
LCIIGILNYIGDVLHLFDLLPGYDVVLHLLAGSLVGMAVFLFWNFFTLAQMSRGKMIVLAVSCALVVGIIWECYELYFGITFLSDGVAYFFDTGKDLTMDVVGGFLGALHSLLVLKNEYEKSK